MFDCFFFFHKHRLLIPAVDDLLLENAGSSGYFGVRVF